MQDAGVDIIDSSHEALYDRFASTILTYLLTQVAHAQDAEDLLLDVFVAALSDTTLDTLSPERQLAWLRRVARNKVIDRYRHNSRIALFPLEQAQAKEDASLTPEQFTEQQEGLRTLHQALARLSPLQQEVLQLRYTQELRLAEIGTILDRSEGAVRKLLARTLRQLHQIYTKIEQGECNETF
ncbi:MAG: sigma-70 family RNA polymerase sigma factor [Ktedonobacteraceae bacterium]|nr:sigma-70 family RNA polymerase sigma factor [Ktedonobacteraceae bacterium]